MDGYEGTGRRDGRITKEQKKTFRGNGGIHYFYRGDDFSDVTCQNRSNYILLICEAYYILIIHQYIYKRRNLKTLRRETKKERNTSYNR